MVVKKSLDMEHQKLIDEVSKYKWEDIDHFAIKDLQVFRYEECDDGYQRALNMDRVNYIDRRFDAGEARMIFISKRDDGTCAIIDGQHTWKVLLKKGFKFWIVRVYYGLTIKEEASLFNACNLNHKRTTSQENFNSSVVAEERDTLAIKKCLAERGICIDKKDKENFHITAIECVRSIYRIGKSKLLGETFDVLIDAYPITGPTFNNRLLKSLSSFLAFSSTPIDRKRLLATFKDIEIGQLNSKLDSFSKGDGGTKRAGAEYLKGIYIAPHSNHGYKTKMRSNSLIMPTIEIGGRNMDPHKKIWV